MNYKCLVNLLYNCHNLPQGRKDFIAARMSETVTRSNLSVWRQLLLNGLAVKEEFFKAYSPVQKSKILSGLCESIRRIKRTGYSHQLFEVLDQLYCLDNGEPSEGKTGAFFRMRLRQNPDKQVKAMLAAVIMELPEQHHRVEEVAAAIHGDYLLSIRAMERLCGLGEPGLKVLYQLLEEVSLTPAIAFTLLRLIENTGCRDCLKRTIAAKVFLRVNPQESNIGRLLLSPRSDPDIRMIRSAEIARALASSRANKEVWLYRVPPRRGEEDPVFLRFSATRKVKTECEGGYHVCATKDTDASLCRRFATDRGDLGGERLRLSVRLKNNGFQTNL